MYTHGRTWCTDTGVRYALLISPYIFTIPLTLLIYGDGKLNQCLMITGKFFFCPVNLGRHSSFASSTSATSGDSFR